MKNAPASEDLRFVTGHSHNKKLRSPAPELSNIYNGLNRYVRALASRDCVHRTGISTCAAIGAFCGIDVKLIVALADCFYWAGGFTGTTGNAFA
jgi:hypothetical protein